MFWKQAFFRIIGVDCFLAGLFAFYYFGKDIFTLFAQVLQKDFDSFVLYTTLSSFFLGALALTWVGMRIMSLRSFSSSWLWYALLPLTVWLQNYYNLGLVFEMDRILSLSVTYILIYLYLTGVVFSIHKYWYTPISHESGRHVGIEHQGRVKPRVLQSILIPLILVGLLILHPEDMDTTIRMLISPAVYLINLIR
jgi:hypothetical protein